MFFGSITAFSEAWGVIALGGVAVFVAAIVRGFAGFGFSLISITAISTIMPVAQIVPTIFLMEIIASLNLLPGIWRQIDWSSLKWVLIGYVVGLPPGTYILMSLPEAPAKIALGVVVIAAAIMMLRGFRLVRRPGPVASSGIGCSSGILNGAFGVGGPPVVLFYFSAPGTAAIGRASIIFYFFCSDLLGAGYFAANGLIGTGSLVQLLAWLPALFAGVWLGARSFRRTSEETFRRWVLGLLIGLAVMTIGQNGYSILVASV